MTITEFMGMHFLLTKGDDGEEYYTRLISSDEYYRTVIRLEPPTEVNCILKDDMLVDVTTPDGDTERMTVGKAYVLTNEIGMFSVLGDGDTFKSDGYTVELVDPLPTYLRYKGHIQTTGQQECPFEGTKAEAEVHVRRKISQMSRLARHMTNVVDSLKDL